MTGFADPSLLEGPPSAIGCSAWKRVTDTEGMPLVGSIIPLKALGVGAQEKRIAREKEDQRRAIAKGGVKRGSDQAEFSTPEVTETEAPREVRGNASEETNEDRRQQAIYDPYRDGLASSKPAAHHLDIQG